MTDDRNKHQPTNPRRLAVKGDPECEACGGVGIIPPGARAVRVCDCRADSTGIEGMCKVLAGKILRVHPDWEKPMRAVMEERHWTFEQLMLQPFAYVYERGLHMTIPADPFFAEGVPETPEIGQCALDTCRKQFKAVYPGQKFCSNDCGVLALPKHRLSKTVTVEPVPAPATEQMQDATLPLYGEHDEFADV